MCSLSYRGLFVKIQNTKWTEFHQIVIVCLYGEGTQYIVRFFDLINFSDQYVALSENGSLNLHLDIAGALTCTKLELSLWNKSSDGIVIRRASMYGLSYRGRFVKNAKTDYSLNNERISPNFYCMLMLVMAHDISYNFFIQIICTAPHPKWYLAHPWIKELNLRRRVYVEIPKPQALAEGFDYILATPCDPHPKGTMRRHCCFHDFYWSPCYFLGASFEVVTVSDGDVIKHDQVSSISS
jgi:hypothetical protein